MLAPAMTTASPATSVAIWCDPACGWSQVSVAWLGRVAAQRDVEFCLRPYSLALRDEVRAAPKPTVNNRRVASLRTLRILEHLRHIEPSLVLPFWESVIAQDGPNPFGDLALALRYAGADKSLGSVADDPRLDDLIQRGMSSVDDLLGARATLPAIVLDDRVAFTGPLLRAVPEPEAALELWDAIATLAAVPGFYELSRPRPPHPAIAGLPPIPEPPVRQAISGVAR